MLLEMELQRQVDKKKTLGNKTIEETKAKGTKRMEDVACCLCSF